MISLAVPSGLTTEDDLAGARRQRGVEQLERVADVTVTGRLRLIRRGAVEPVCVVIVVRQRDVAVRVVAPLVAPVERAAAHHDGERQGKRTRKPTIPSRPQPHLMPL